MDGLMNLAQGALASQLGGGQQQQQQQQPGMQQGATPGIQAQSGGGFDFAALLGGANQQHGSGDALSGMLSTALGSAQKVNANAEINEAAVRQDHDQAYNQGNASSLSAQGMGAAAAMQAFRAFAGSGGAAQSTAGGGQSWISMLLGMAMAEAAKLFDKSGGAANGDKQDVMNSAGQTIMKLLVQNQIQGALGGSGGGGGGGVNPAQLIGLASKFL